MPTLTLTQKIAYNLIVTIAVAVAMIGGVLIWLATQADRQAGEATQRMVQGGLEQNLDFIHRHVNDYAFWEDAWSAANRGDKDWLDGNVGSGVLESKTVSGIAIADPNGLIKFKWEGAINSGRTPEYFPVEVLNLIKTRLHGRVARPEEAQTFYWQIENTVLAYAAQRLTPHADTTQAASADRDLMIFARELSASDVLQMGSPFLINDLAIEAGNYYKVLSKKHISIPVLDLQGKEIALLHWSAPRPGTHLLKAIALPVSVALLVMLLSGSWTTWRASSLAKQLELEKNVATTIAQTDTLTALPNRVGFNDFIDQAEVRELAEMGAFAVWQIDLNNFKSINDSLGHKFGDALLKAIAKLLQTLLPSDTFLARTGSNEFLVVGLGFELVRDASVIACHIASTLSKGLMIEGHNFDVSSAVCYAVATAKALQPQDVIQRAGLAMAEAKSRRFNGVMVYDQALESALLETQAIEVVLRRAISEDGFCVHYQPIFNAETGRIDHAEALVRLAPELGVSFGPDKFIAVAEKTGLIQDIGLIVLKQVVRDALYLPDLKIGVNVSPVQLLNSNFVETAADIVKKGGLLPSNIAFELTEGVLVDSPDLARRQLQALKQYGFEIYLDDFGSGFSSIGYLKQFPFDALKIDRSVVQAAFESEQGHASLKAIASLASAMNMSIFAEGIENQEEFDLLAKLGCRWLQGWHIGKPVIASGLRTAIDSFVLSNRSANVLRRKAAEMRAYLPVGFDERESNLTNTQLAG
jgi:diguanylate cyclase (GGDEF)-like protein